MADQNQKPPEAEARAIIESMKDYLGGTLLELDRDDSKHVLALVVPKGCEARSIKPLLDEYRSAPERKKGFATLLDLHSFTEHVNRFKNPHSLIFASPGDAAGPGVAESPRLQAVYDYNEPTGGPARFHEHGSFYRMPFSDEWIAWMKVNAQPMGQKAFAEFIEDRIADIALPAGSSVAAIEFSAKLGARFSDPGALLQVSRGLEARVNSVVKNATRLESGEVQMNYVTEHTDAAGAALRVPSAFLIAIPVFRGGLPWEIAVRLRYRINTNEGRVAWSVELYRADRVKNAAFEEVCAKVAADTGLAVLTGAPE